MQRVEKTIAEKIMDFEACKWNQKAILAYKHWIALSDAEKSQIWSEWNRYYEECRVSEPAAIFWDMREVFKTFNKVKIRELRNRAQEIREQRLFVKEPQSINPYWYMHNQAISIYRSLLHQRDIKSGQMSSGPDEIFT